MITKLLLSYTYMCSPIGQNDKSKDFIELTSLLLLRKDSLCIKYV